jgi:hypothetical protein
MGPWTNKLNMFIILYLITDFLINVIGKKVYLVGYDLVALLGIMKDEKDIFLKK